MCVTCQQQEGGARAKVESGVTHDGAPTMQPQAATACGSKERETFYPHKCVYRQCHPPTHAPHMAQCTSASLSIPRLSAATRPHSADMSMPGGGSVVRKNALKKRGFKCAACQNTCRRRSVGWGMGGRCERPGRNPSPHHTHTVLHSTPLPQISRSADQRSLNPPHTHAPPTHHPPPPSHADGPPSSAAPPGLQSHRQQPHGTPVCV